MHVLVILSKTNICVGNKKIKASDAKRCAKIQIIKNVEVTWSFSDTSPEVPKNKR